MSAATVRSNYVDYKFMRAGFLNRNEQALAWYIFTFSTECRMPLEEIAKSLRCSISTVRRALNSLIQKGVVNRRYTVFKRLILTLADRTVQQALTKPGAVYAQIMRVAMSKLKKKRVIPHDRSRVNEVKVSPVNEPTRRETKEENSLGSDLKIDRKDPRESIPGLAELFAKLESVRPARV